MNVTGEHIETGKTCRVDRLSFTHGEAPSGKATLIVVDETREPHCLDTEEFFETHKVYYEGEEATKRLRALVFPTKEGK